MAEEYEVPSAHEHHIHHEAHSGVGLSQQVAIFTAVLATLGAIISYQGGHTQNEALYYKNDAVLNRTLAADQWAYYQAKGIKAAVAEASGTSWAAIGKAAPAQYAANQKRYLDEQKEIQKKAQEKEKERDEKSTEADHLLHRHHRFADAVALLQVSIALGAVAALTRSRLVWIGSIGVGACGLVLFGLTFLQ